MPAIDNLTERMPERHACLDPQHAHVFPAFRSKADLLAALGGSMSKFEIRDKLILTDTSVWVDSRRFLDDADLQESPQ